MRAYLRLPCTTSPCAGDQPTIVIQTTHHTRLIACDGSERLKLPRLTMRQLARIDDRDGHCWLEPITWPRAIRLLLLAIARSLRARRRPPNPYHYHTLPDDAPDA